MDDEITAMVKFGVFTRMPRSAAGRRQILGCRWVYKRKTNRFGEVYRYRARLVAQGFRQRAYDVGMRLVISTTNMDPRRW